MKNEELTHKRQVALTTLDSGKQVSTVLLPTNNPVFELTRLLTAGLYSPDEGMAGQYETMVFPSNKNRIDLDAARYDTLEEAKLGHAAMVEKWKDK